MITLITVIAALYVMAFLAFRVVGLVKEKRGKPPLVILAGGGTGGHVYPLLAIYEEIAKRHPNYRFLYIGVPNKAESHIVPREGIELWYTYSIGYPGLKNPIILAKFLTILLAGSLKCAIKFTIEQPKYLVSTGGYVSAPAIVAAVVLRKVFRIRIGIFLHEQNTVPGQLNHFFGRWADIVFVSFRETMSFFPENGVFSGYPVRRRVQEMLSRSEENSAISVPHGKKVVFVFGGSQGARTINRALVDAIPYLYPYRKKIFIIHGRGLARTEEYDAVKDTEDRISRLDDEIKKELESFYYSQAYFHNIGAVYRIADLVVARSGAGTLNEIAALGKPALLIPKSGLPGDHQVINARAMKNAGAAQVLYEDVRREPDGRVVEFVDGQTLASAILRLLQDPSLLSSMAVAAKSFFRGNAAETIVDCIDYPSKARDLHKSSVKLSRLSVESLPSNDRVLKLLSINYSENPETFNPYQVFDPEDVEYFRYRAVRLLYHPKWQIRNVGVKLVGYLLHRDKVPEILRMITDRTPVPLWLRLLGGDYREVGFIRRNSIRALQIMDIFNADVEEALMIAIDDPYYEVRSEACRAVCHFSNKLAGKDKWLQKILERFNDPSFEVVCEAAKAMGYIGIDGRAVEALLQFAMHPLWQIRYAALLGILRLLERRVICPCDGLVERLGSFILTSTDFVPHFRLKETYRQIVSLCGTTCDE